MARIDDRQFRAAVETVHARRRVGAQARLARDHLGEGKSARCGLRARFFIRQQDVFVF
jgi:hypothetical protein